MIGSWGAFWSSLVLIFGSVALWYNDKKWHFLADGKKIFKYPTYQENALEFEENDDPVLNVVGKKLGRVSSEMEGIGPGNPLKSSIEGKLGRNFQ